MENQDKDNEDSTERTPSNNNTDAQCHSYVEVEFDNYSEACDEEIELDAYGSTEDTLWEKIEFDSREATESGENHPMMMALAETKVTLRPSSMASSAAYLKLSSLSPYRALSTFDYRGLGKSVILPQLSDSFELESGRRHYYDDCKYHFPVEKSPHSGIYSGPTKCFGRTYKNWIYFILYLICFVVLLTLFNIVMCHHLSEHLDMKTPKIKISQPNMRFAPLDINKNHKLIEYDLYNDKDIEEMRDYLHHFLRQHGKIIGHNKRFGPCQEYNYFGYDTRDPCVFLKFNRLIGFKTNPYTNADELSRIDFNRADYEALKQLLSSITSEEKRMNRIWITCSVEPKGFVEIEFYPEPAIKTNYTDLKEVTAIATETDTIYK